MTFFVDRINSIILNRCLEGMDECCCESTAMWAGPFMAVSVTSAAQELFNTTRSDLRGEVKLKGSALLKRSR
jgi:hypothetical protein